MLPDEIPDWKIELRHFALELKIVRAKATRISIQLAHYQEIAELLEEQVREQLQKDQEE